MGIMSYFTKRQSRMKEPGHCRVAKVYPLGSSALDHQRADMASRTDNRVGVSRIKSFAKPQRNPLTYIFQRLSRTSSAKSKQLSSDSLPYASNESETSKASKGTPAKTKPSRSSTGGNQSAVQVHHVSTQTDTLQPNVPNVTNTNTALLPIAKPADLLPHAYSKSNTSKASSIIAPTSRPAVREIDELSRVCEELKELIASLNKDLTRENKHEQVKPLWEEPTAAQPASSSVRTKKCRFEVLPEDKHGKLDRYRRLRHNHTELSPDRWCKYWKAYAEVNAQDSHTQIVNFEQYVKKFEQYIKKRIRTQLTDVKHSPQSLVRTIEGIRYDISMERNKQQLPKYWFSLTRNENENFSLSEDDTFIILNAQTSAKCGRMFLLTSQIKILLCFQETLRELHTKLKGDCQPITTLSTFSSSHSHQANLEAYNDISRKQTIALDATAALEKECGKCKNELAVLRVVVEKNMELIEQKTPSNLIEMSKPLLTIM